MLQLYLHFPFCKRKCFYCDFCSAPGGAEDMEAYAALLEKEILLAAEAYGHEPISTVFLGGGTPTLMPVSAMNRVLTALGKHFTLPQGIEFTAEGNPGTLTGEWLDMAKGHGLNRLSLGVQAAQDKHLYALGRIHRFEEAGEAACLAKAHGIANLNVDVMFGLPGQTPAEYLETLEAVCALEPTHISAYSLIVEEGTLLSHRLRLGECALPEEDETCEMYEQGIALLEGRGYRQYEISNFAKEGYECAHNLGYWQGAWYLGLGLGSHSMLPTSPDEGADAAYLRRENTTDMGEYAGMLEAQRLPLQASTPVSHEDALFETMMLGLRTKAGVDANAFAARHGRPLTEVYGKQLKALVLEGLGLWRENGAGESGEGSFALTAKGLGLQNSVLMRFMK